MLEDRAVQEHDRFGFETMGLAEVTDVDVSVWAQAADHPGPWRHVHGVAMGPDGHFTVIADAHANTLAPDKWRPRAGGCRAQRRTVIGEGLIAGGLGRDVDFAVEFAGAGAVGGGRLGGEQAGEQGAHLGRPVGMVIAAGEARCPGVGLAVSAGVQVFGVELVEAAAREAQFRRGVGSVEMTGGEAGQEVAKEGRRTTIG